MSASVLPTPTPLPPSAATASQREIAAIAHEMRGLATQLRSTEAYQLQVLANRLTVQCDRDVAALEYSDAALDRAIAFYRQHRTNPVLTPKGLMDGVLHAARGSHG